MAAAMEKAKKDAEDLMKKQMEAEKARSHLSASAATGRDQRRSCNRRRPMEPLGEAGSSHLAKPPCIPAQVT